MLKTTTINWYFQGLRKRGKKWYALGVSDISEEDCITSTLEFLTTQYLYSEFRVIRQEVVTRTEVTNSNPIPHE